MRDLGYLLHLFFIRHRAFTILHFELFFLKTTIPIVGVFGVKHLYRKRNINCEIYGTNISEAPYAEPNMQNKNTKFLKIFFYTPIHVGIKLNTWS